MKSNVMHEAPGQTIALPDALANINTRVLDDDAMRRMVDSDIYDAFTRCRSTGNRMSKEDANALATSIRKWAQERGCVGYSHWFSPMRGPVHGEKLETFMAVDFETDRLVVNLTGSELFQSETDGSSFPNGGLRLTHEAAAYMGWDTGSPPFIYGETLFIPSAFVSWTGDALDQKTPLLRSNAAVNKQALRMLKHLGDQKTEKVVCNVGWEQEFFVIDRENYLARPDLVATGRTLIGQTPLRGQEQSTSYFSKVSPRMRRFLDMAREEMWALGISIDCTHHEVAPAQLEISPIFSLSNLAADTNVLAMEVLSDLSFDNDLAVLFHEKPFAGINGSGKHNNWGLNTDKGDNLFVPGDGTYENRRFIAFVAALLRATHKHGDLLRIGVSTAGNDHRLGAQEAPPAIFTLYLGKRLEEHMRKAAAGDDITGYGGEDKNIRVSEPVAEIKASLEDRNRTAPFPWCGNRFEFRAVGSNQQIAFPMAMVNAAIADSLKHMCDQVNAGQDLDEVIRETIGESQVALFSGDGYSSELYEVAEKGGLIHLENSPDAYQELTSDKNLKLFVDLEIFNEQELAARQEVLLEAFATELRDLIQELLDETDSLAEAFDAFPSEESLNVALYAQDTIKPRMESARAVADQLEGLVDRRLWPFPTYTEILYDHQ